MLNKPLFQSALIQLTEGSKSLSCIPELEGSQKRTVAKIDPEVSQKEGTEKSGIAYKMKQRTHEADNNNNNKTNNTTTTSSKI